MLVAENILYIKPYCMKALQEKAAAYEAETHEEFDFGADMRDGMCAFQPRKFHDMIYYTIVTFTSVGYGDIAP